MCLDLDSESTTPRCAKCVEYRVPKSSLGLLVSTESKLAQLTVLESEVVDMTGTSHDTTIFKWEINYLCVQMKQYCFGEDLPRNPATMSSGLRLPGAAAAS